MIQRGGAVVIRMLANVQHRTITPLIQATIVPGTCVYTDEYAIKFITICAILYLLTQEVP
jgi:transposase